ncbi:hypothetical protein H4J46_01380 [Colwellia sp. MB02u-6]|uniref:hypothetical protein n=1 Tax=Colwellia sp. MB02u-6 TaxID=2759824 RepID=UPI0015F4723C|nr:hypothetical protein [Colwellia sp. MB02u-6]MBA6326613.1 hypothetical protein [Colwellia sp. MB02u-6]
MNSQKINLLKNMTSGLILLIATTSLAAFAASNSAKDKELLIHVDPSTHCAIKVAPSVNESNCTLLYSESKNPCKNDPECVCSKKEKNITWQTTSGDAFDIRFTEGSPFKRCEYSAERDGEVRCKIKNSGDYYYEVNVEGCATNPYDPRIVVQ